MAPTREGFASVDEETLLEEQKKASNIDIASLGLILEEGMSLGPLIDGDLIVRPTIESLRMGIGSDKPLVLGSTDDEFAMAVQEQEKMLRWMPLALILRPFKVSRTTRKAYLAANPETVARGHAAVLGRFITDKMFRTAVVKVASMRGKAPTWVYRVAFRSGVFGSAVHCIDVPFFFDCLDGPALEPLTGRTRRRLWPTRSTAPPSTSSRTATRAGPRGRPSRMPTSSSVGREASPRSRAAVTRSAAPALRSGHVDSVTGVLFSVC
ncbi:carboxylesterase family protein [Tessaracoccus coleopterorum]|uniref:carboxylesterase family protein n=1 Tax=Tessaracoccus coleopterorum TaxID=2714950 RepID=UPI002F908851